MEAFVASSSAALSQILTLVGRFLMALAKTVLAFSGVCSLAPSSQTSSLSGQASHPALIVFRAWQHGREHGAGGRRACAWVEVGVCVAEFLHRKSLLFLLVRPHHVTLRVLIALEDRIIVHVRYSPWGVVSSTTSRGRLTPPPRITWKVGGGWGRSTKRAVVFGLVSTGLS